uniref:Lysosomal Pro-X carboxypeptidase n=1 Tax=Kalanchoe fedtschenkoi TaxID=63787 RepID=A0A7N0V1B0_KALFE
MASKQNTFLLLCLLSPFFIISSSPVSDASNTPNAKFLRRPFGHPQRLSQDTNVRSKPYKTRYFTQTLDHFNYHPQSYQTFQHRYLINDAFWGGAESDAPIFVYTGNEGDIEWFAQNTGFLFEKAPHFKALLVFIEHRYYGKSIPFNGDKDVAYSNSSTLGYMSSTQALADYATLIIDLKKNLSAEDSPVVVVGGSYGGMLAAWFRLKYPHVAVGALASSAPILNFGNLTSPYSFTDIITRDFRGESETCYKVIKESWEQIEDTANQHGGLERLRKTFRICKGFILQACTEMILPTDGNNEESIFPESKWDYEERVEQCRFYYGVLPRPNWITTEFGGQDIKRVLKRFASNIIFFNGLRDPWSGGGVLSNISDSIVAIVAKEGAHHVDLRFSTSEDPKWLKDVRMQEVKIISTWLSKYYYDLSHL